MAMQANSLHLDGTLHLQQFIDVAQGEKVDGDEKYENTKKDSLKMKCKVCWKHKLDRKTVFECKKGKVALHITATKNCFALYHTEESY